MKNIGQYIENEIKESVQTEENRYLSILRKANGSDLSWMEEYGRTISEEEKETAAFYFLYPKEKICKMAEHIVEAFLHGFISQNRERKGRKRVRLFYQVGQEALAACVADCLLKNGLKPVVIDPMLPERPKKEQLYLDEISEEMISQLYDRAFLKYKEEALDVCGMIGIGQFGKPDTETQSKERKILERGRRLVEDSYVQPATISFSKVAFPSLQIGDNFHEIFDEVFEMNLEESEKFEKIQQILIDALDRCKSVRIIGKKPNQTSLNVQMQPIRDPQRETNFMNCGGDLNIPYGEVFTTPQLKGTTGVLHIPDIYLQNRKYHNLKLWFEDGQIADYSSEAEGQETKELIREELLSPYETLPAGEFAIGTNTRAFRICKKYHLEDKMPILIYEKMGPHLAIGDPCYRGGEEEAVYNLLDGKEITARTNEKTRNEDSDDKKYVQKHIDITLPYDEIEELYGYGKEGETIKIIKDGKFVLPGTDELNLGMEERRQEA